MFWAPGEWKPEMLYNDLGRAEVAEIAWQHWPSMNIFTQISGAQIVRNVTYGLTGVSPSEAQFLQIKRDTDAEGGKVQTRVLETRDGHVAGLATLVPERRWGREAATWVFDLFLHPEAADHASALAARFVWPEAHVLAYAAETDQSHIDALAGIGFRPHGHLERFFAEGVGLVIMDRG
jgi:hypothetical protein